MPTAKEIGDAVEDKAIDTLQGRKVKQSGGGKFFKSDGRDRVFIWECKGSLRGGIRITKEMFLKASQAARGMRGVDNARPGIIIGIGEDDDLDSIELYALVKLDDHAALATGEIEPYLEPKKKGGLRKRLQESKL